MIFDCFPFYNELDLLELRLRELDGSVDAHVLVEATTTHSGKSKPLYYADNKERFAAWRDKIIHVVVNLSDPEEGDSRKRWVRENAQRDALVRGLERADAKRNDVVLVSDCDEIPRASKVTEFAKIVANGDIAGGLLRFYYYFLNGYRDYPWRSVIGLSVEACVARTPTEWRTDYMKRRIRLQPVDEAGWHFSFLGGVDVISDKFEAYAHEEFDRMFFKSKEMIAKRIEEGTDPVGRANIKIEYVEVDDTFPRDIVERPGAYAHLIRR
jgi:hypothetical protein